MIDFSFIVDLLIESSIHWLISWLILPLINWLILPKIGRWIDYLIDSSIHWLINSSICWFFYWLIFGLVHPLIDWFFNFFNWDFLLLRPLIFVCVPPRLVLSVSWLILETHFGLRNNFPNLEKIRNLMNWRLLAISVVLRNNPLSSL